MIQFVRSLFGLNGSSSARKVIGTTTGFDSQEVTYIKDSNKRLTALLDLQKKYKGTSHEEKIKLVLEKTKRVHWFLLSKKRVHELELFHIRNTDNFISTFSLIIEVYRRHREDGFSALEAEARTPAPTPIPAKKPEVAAAVPKVEPLSNGSRSDTGKKGELFDIVEKVRQRNKQSSVIYALEKGAEVATLAIPEVQINTVAKAFYQKESVPGKQVAQEISFVSTQQEKDAFQAFVAERLGMKDIYYVGNARLKVPDNKGAIADEILPIFYLRNYLYAISLTEFRMYPVKMYRKTP